MKRIFYDDTNPFCVWVVRRLKELDRKNQYTFSSIDGTKAKSMFSGNYGFLRRKGSIVFLEGKRVWVRANAVLRLLWLSKSKWRFLGALFVIPGFLINPFYRFGMMLVRK